IRRFLAVGHDLRTPNSPFTKSLLQPLHPRRSWQGSPTYGFITSTPKPGWNMVDVVGYLSDGSVPCKFDTDVNAPALAEYMVREM
ncbi:unnamed protein product, partial [Hapterophycus canaliculatus]